MSQLKNLAAIALSGALLWGCSGGDEAVELSPKMEQEVAERIAPAGEVVKEGDVSTAAVASASAEPRSGADVVQASCFACHGTGAAGAPKIGDAAVWAARLEAGIETVYANAINGIRGMPPRGTCMACSDDELKAAVDHMVENSN